MTMGLARALLASAVFWFPSATVLATVSPSQQTTGSVAQGTVAQAPTAVLNSVSAADSSGPAGQIQQAIGLAITDLLDGEVSRAADGNVGLDHKLWVTLSRPPAVPASHYVLFLNGTEIRGLSPTTDTTYKSAKGEMVYALVFHLRRTAENDAFWRELLSAPTAGTVPVRVSLGERSEPCYEARACAAPQLSIGGATTLKFRVYSQGHLIGGFVAIAVVLALVWGFGRTRTTLRDNFLPQLPAAQQTYSLGRWQMAFWFSLVFAAFVFLFVVLHDTNTITAQALMLMGISGCTALASIAVDVKKDSSADAANRGLQALGLNTYEDVRRVHAEIAAREEELAKEPPNHRRKQLQVEIQDRRLVLQTYHDKIKPFVSQGWFRDLTTDLNGSALHRVQALCWTVVLGVVFVIGVYENLSMAEFSGTLLALMGISNAGYVGFKYPEVNT